MELSNMYVVVFSKLKTFIGDYVFLKYRLAHPKYCATMKLYGQHLLQTPVAFAVQKKSKWNDLLSRSILKFRSTSEIGTLIKKWFYLPNCSGNMNKAAKFPWKYIGGMIVAVSCFVVVSAIVVLLETHYTNVKTNRKDTSNCTVTLTSIKKTQSA